MSIGIWIDYDMLKDKNIDFRLLSYMLRKAKKNDDNVNVFFMDWLDKKDFFKRSRRKSETIIMSHPTLNKYLKKMQEVDYSNYFRYNIDEDKYEFYLDIHDNPSRNFILIMSNDMFDNVYYEYNDLLWRIYLYLYRKNYEYHGNFKIALGKLLQEVGYTNSTQNRDKCRLMLEYLRKMGCISYVNITEQGNESNHIINRIQINWVKVN